VIKRTALREEEQEHQLHAGWDGTQTDHPSPPTRNMKKACADSIGDDLTKRNHHHTDIVVFVSDLHSA
jgi:hypothetical protein